MVLSARLQPLVVLTAALGFALGSGLPADSAPTAAPIASTTPSLGEALTPSSAAQLALVDHLRARGVVFYGAFWCQHCFRQKLLFGKEAGNRLPYVECAKDAAGAQACAEAEVLAYPTWVMGNERKVGLQSLAELAAWTGFQPSGAFTPTGRAR